ncbi:hypothetical protein [Barnesiella viscericola]|uniref:hypothetical protein n=1 Tax=Barnesiella viscericola TaxID=397865 RepID=UPI0012F9AC73|nr:hypothetical protein [Barnesiella viscericola]
MKKKIFALCLFAAFFLNSQAQAPDSFQYQAVVSDNNATLNNADVTVRLVIHEKSATGTTVYAETHSTRTNNFGLIALQVGKGTPETGTFAAIEWGKGTFFIETQIDKGAGFVSTGTQQLMSVPYAKYANLAGKITLTSASGKKFALIIDDNGALSTQEITAE